MTIFLLIALGIGLHDLGEGLAVGAAYAVGEVALGTSLVFGFLLHNTTEGLGILAPLAHSRPTVQTLAGLGLTAGLPRFWAPGSEASPTRPRQLFSSFGSVPEPSGR